MMCDKHRFKHILVVRVLIVTKPYFFFNFLFSFFFFFFFFLFFLFLLFVFFCLLKGIIQKSVTMSTGLR